MELLQTFYDGIKSFIPLSVAIVISIIVIYVVRQFMDRQITNKQKQSLRRQLVTLILFFAALLIVILTLPISDNLRGQLLSLLGILFSAAIALSSTTFIGNAFAGMMLRAVRSFRPGDFIMVGDYIGRVSERGLFHIEIQTEDRDLITMPNLYLVTNPVRVIRSSGTIVSAEVSLGYDLSRTLIENLLLEAAKSAGLEEPFVHITNLGDFSVTYRIAGLLTEVKQLISARSRLREKVLDSLHRGGVEIVSPTFMNTRALSERKKFIPEANGADVEKIKAAPEKIVFDKAEQAESLEKMRERYEMLVEEIESSKERIKQTENASLRDEIALHLEWQEQRKIRLAEIIKRREAADKED